MSKSTDSEATRTLVVKIEEVLVPITVEILHRVFDQFGAVEEIEIHPKKDNLQAVVRFQVLRSANSAKISLDRRYIFDEGCLMHIEFLSDTNSEKQLEQNFVIKKTNHETLETLKQRSIEIEIMMDSLRKTMHRMKNTMAPTILLDKPSTVGFVHMEEELNKSVGKEASTQIDAQVLDEMLVSDIEELATEKMGTNDISLNDESKELEEKEITVAIDKHMSEKMVVKEVETVNKVFDNLPVCEIKKLISTEIVADRCGDWFLEESGGKVQKLPDGLPVDERVDCYPTSKHEETMICISFEPTICINEVHIRTVIEEIQEERCYNEGEFPLYCSFATGAYFIIDPGGSIIYKRILHLFEHFNFENGLEHLDDWHFDISRGSHSISRGHLFGTGVIVMLVECSKSEKYDHRSLQFLRSCSVVETDIGVGHNKLGESGFTIQIPWQHDFGVNSIKIYFLILGVILDKISIIVGVLPSSLICVENSSSSYWITTTLFEKSLKLMVDQLCRCVHGESFLKADQMLLLIQVKNLRIEGNLMNHVIRSVQNLMSCLLESYLGSYFRVGEVTRSTKELLNQLQKLLNDFLNKELLDLRYPISLLKFTYGGKGETTTVKLDLDNFVVSEWDCLIMKVCSIPKILRSTSLRIGEIVLKTIFGDLNWKGEQALTMNQSFKNIIKCKYDEIKSCAEMSPHLDVILVSRLADAIEFFDQLVGNSISQMTLECTWQSYLNSTLMGDGALLFALDILKMHDLYSLREDWQFQIWVVIELDVKEYKNTSSYVHWSNKIHKAQQVFSELEAIVIHTGLTSLIILLLHVSQLEVRKTGTFGSAQFNRSSQLFRQEPNCGFYLDTTYCYNLVCSVSISLFRGKWFLPSKCDFGKNSTPKIFIEGYLLAFELILKNCESRSLRTRIISTGEKCHDHDTYLGAILVFGTKKQGLIWKGAKTCVTMKVVKLVLYYMHYVLSLLLST